MLVLDASESAWSYGKFWVLGHVLGKGGACWVREIGKCRRLSSGERGEVGFFWI